MNLEYFKRFNPLPEEAKPNNNVWLYTRVSSKKQYDDNGSLDTQKLAAYDYANNKYTITKTFGETYESAKGDFTRKEFKNLIDTVKKSKNKPFAIMIFKVNRFSRSGGNAIALLQDLIHKHGVHLIEVSSGKDTTSQLGEHEIMQLLLSAKKENMTRLDVTIPGMKAFVRKGNWLGSAPKGYRHQGKRVNNPDDFSGAQIITINDNGKLLKKAWKWKLEGEYDYVIRQKLKSFGLVVEKQWLSQMWRKPFYCGISTHKFLDGKPIKGNWSPIVSIKDFKIINARLEATKNGYKQSKYPTDRPLQSHLFCGNCGGKMTGYVKKKTIHYYKCQNRKCTCKDLNANSSKRSLKEGLHNIFHEYLEQFELSPSLENAFREQMKLTIESQNKEEIQFVKSFDGKIIQLNDKLEKLEDKYLYEDYPRQKYEFQKSKLESELLKILEEKEKLNLEISNLDNKIDYCVEITKNISENWGSGDYQFKTKLQKLMFPHGIVIEPENRQYRTSKVNQIFLLTSSISRDSEQKAKNPSTELVNGSCLVAGTGLEPVTFGL